jgi:hypothetical protein
MTYRTDRLGRQPGSLRVRTSSLLLPLLLGVVGCGRSLPVEVDDDEPLVCPGVLVACEEGGCTDLDSDRRNCGLCGVVCERGSFCVEGACVDACPEPPLRTCGDRCVDLTSAPQACGACDVSCGETGFCEAGVCSDRCPEPLSRCGARCLDTSVDPANCGACGVACPDDQVCSAGSCLLECPAGTTRCSGSCVDIDADPANCGGCGEACATSAVCRAGACIPILDLTDTDGDTIADVDEGRTLDPPPNTDGDSFPDFEDRDSDGDGLLDAVEAGDADPTTRPVDTDGDGIPDFRDLDSDADGLSDAREAESGCLDPTRGDSDGDGQSDLAEDAAGTDPCDPDSRIPEFFYVLPPDDPSGESAATLTFDTTIRKADIHFNVDTTGSMDDEIDNLQDSLTSVVIPGIGARIPDAAFGVSEFEDFPVTPFGNLSCDRGDPDRPFRLLQQMTTDLARVEAGLAGLDDPIGCGGDLPEAGYESLYQVATGEGVGWPAGPGGLWPAGEVPPTELDDAIPGAGDRGGVGFRQGAFPVVVQVTDAESHVRDAYVGSEITEAHSKDQVIAALDELGARVIGIASSFVPRPQLEELALTTGGFIPPTDGACLTAPDGLSRPPVEFEGEQVCPLVYDVAADGGGLSETLVEGVVNLVTALRFETVSVRVVGDDFGFIQGVIPRSAESPPGSAAPTVTDLDGDSVFDAFVGVTPGTLVTFTVLAFNDAVAATDVDQVFTVTLEVLGDGVAVLDQQLVVIVVPRAGG